jgi:hypothetical protein
VTEGGWRRTLSLETLQAIAAISQILLALIALVVSVIALIVTARITWIVNKRAKRIAKLQYWRAVSNVWMEINKFVLSSEQNLVMADHLFNPKFHDQPIEARRKRWFGYMVLNVFSDTYLGVDRPLEMDQNQRADALKELKPLLRDDVLYDLSQSGIYTTEFQEACTRLREELGKTATTQPGVT